MKELNYHSDNLISISALDTSEWGDKMFFKNMLSAFCPDMYILFLGRKVYDFYDLTHVENMLIKKSEALDLYREQTSIKHENQLAFSIVKNSSDIDLFELLSELWYVFEQPSIVLTENNQKFVSSQPGLSLAQRNLSLLIEMKTKARSL